MRSVKRTTRTTTITDDNDKLQSGAGSSGNCFTDPSHRKVFETLCKKLQNKEKNIF
ncbi:MAG: hypothetical protein ACI4PX_00250 [Ruminococcus sp.]